ncbi:CDP-alcohol phosphatidyltransferase family protein [candidate division KSB1 bacterium]|nr:CDP-alcohol phosphatidyltransferase family protein [candidate division KSB1 bacterium]
MTSNDQPVWRFWTVANGLSIIRILLIPAIVYCILHESKSYFWFGVGLVFVAIATDYLDGKMARRLNQVSEYGKIFDPLADKIAIGTLAVLLVIYRDLPVWVAILIIGRDFLILLFGLFLTTRLKYVTSSTRFGKWTAFMIALMIVAYILRWGIVATILTWNAVLFSVLSGIFYLIRFVKVFKKPRS